MSSTKSSTVQKTQATKPAISSICVVRLSALGDCFLLVPMLQELHRQFPTAKIHWIIERSLAPVFESLENITLIPIDKPSRLKDYWQLRQSLAEHQFDVLLATQASLRVNLIYSCITAKRKIGFDANRAKDLHGFFIGERISPRQEHLLEGFMGFLEHLIGGKVNNLSSRISWPLALDHLAEDWADQELRKLPEGFNIAINPSASKLERTPQANFYIETIQQLLLTYRCNIILTGAPSAAEIELSRSIAEVFSKHDCVVNLTGKTSLPQVIAILAKADCLIAPDTGPVHIATAFGTPVIGLYAVITAKLSGPYLNSHLVIDKYPEALQEFLNQTLASTQWGTRVHRREAMNLIKVSDVMDKLAQLGTLGNFTISHE